MRAIQELGVLPLTLAILAAMRVARPWVQVRIALLNARVGHLAANTELYLCTRERDRGGNPREVHLFFAGLPVPNHQLVRMWSRRLTVLPAWLLRPVYRLNAFLPDGESHTLQLFTPYNRDVEGLFAQTGPHLSFTEEEEERGQAELRVLGIPEDAPFVCILGRDELYTRAHQPALNFDHHDYRNVTIQNFARAAEALAERGIFVVRLGSMVKAPFRSQNPSIIDYATSGMRSEFMDIYLSAKCEFFVSVGTGLDAVAMVFRRPMVYVNAMPLGYIHSFLANTLCLSKTHWVPAENRMLSLREIFDRGAGFCLDSADYGALGVQTVENTPEEIREVVLEMADRLEGRWREQPGDEERQRRFWEVFPLDACDRYQRLPLHGAVRARYGAQYLRDHPEWLT